MDLRSNLDDMSAAGRIAERRRRAEESLHVDLSLLAIAEPQIGSADVKNCEQMIGAVPVPIGIAGPLRLTLSTQETCDRYLPLATTEGALVASVNRGCKALVLAGGVRVQSVHHGVTRSLALFVGPRTSDFGLQIRKSEQEWKAIGESTSKHLTILSYDIDTSEEYLFLTIACDTDEAMGMNMVTIAAEAIGRWIEKNLDMAFVTVAANLDSDKKPSRRTKERGRGYEVTAEAVLTEEIIRSVLKTTPEAMRLAADAKLRVGSALAGTLGRNLQAANIIAALYLATGQDAAHVVEGSLADTNVERLNEQRATSNEKLIIRTRLPALMVGVHGGGTALPAQKQCLSLLLDIPKSEVRSPKLLHPCRLLAEIIGAAVLAGELSLLAAQAEGNLGSAHAKLGR